MPKICKKEDCDRFVWGKGFCAVHQYLRPDKQDNYKVPSKKSQQNERAALRNKQYKKAKGQYIMQYGRATCEVSGCTNYWKDLHHKAGRIGPRLTMKSTFMLVCRSCHNQIHENPKWAREEGYLITVK